MKLFLVFVTCLLSYNAMADVDIKSCPKKFTLTYSNLNRIPLNEEIQNDYMAFRTWNFLDKVKNIQESFQLSNSMGNSICFYVNDHSMAFIVPQQGIFELSVSLEASSGMAITVRTKVASISNGKLTVTNDEADKIFYTQIRSEETNEVTGQINVVKAESVTIK
jgi:hypothetical protein